MKNSMYSLLFLALFYTFNGCSKKAEIKEPETPITNKSVADSVKIEYTDCPVAYLVDGQLYFYSLEQKSKVKFAEESEPILNFVFDAEGKTLYYTVERDKTLWLKSAEIGSSEISPQWLNSWKLKKENEGFMNVGMSPLYYDKGKIIVMHGYQDDSQYYDRMTYYNIKEKKIAESPLDIELIRSTYGMLTQQLSDKYFKINDEQLYYKSYNEKVCLTDKIDFKAIEEKNKDQFEISATRFYTHYIFSPDNKKVAFGVEMLEGGDWVQGPFCIANIDGTKQMVLEESNFIIDSHPVWLNNNEFVFKSLEGDLYIANNNKNTTEKIAEEVGDFKARN